MDVKSVILNGIVDYGLWYSFDTAMLARLCVLKIGKVHQDDDIHESSPSSFQDVSPASSESVHAKFGINDVTEFVSMETVPDIDTDSFNDNDNVAFSELLRHPYRSDADSSPIVPISDVPIPPKVPSSEAPSMFATNDDDLIRYFVRGSSGSYSHAPSIVVTSGSAFVSSSIPPSVSRYMSNPSTTSTVFPSSSQLGTSTVPSGGTPSTAPFESFTQASVPYRPLAKGQNVVTTKASRCKLSPNHRSCTPNLDLVTKVGLIPTITEGSHVPNMPASFRPPHSSPQSFAADMRISSVGVVSSLTSCQTVVDPVMHALHSVIADTQERPSDTSKPAS
ncbi:mucin-5AC-like isoform X3 [Cucumis melo var. makuwa]|uniref:Mucin-5AC-like isoform X3 n=1 Tax=Cucumis melo var. makuwa TaxID=1194695 RepID=A0A5D3CS05_CUCMM|nr:mucin-5AC-like isoform X3 [Cucumis melo var. makuwa]TYK14190.1 mucin-5AC-like isoform X3 [Cucumis melo var. makuwa]